MNIYINCSFIFPGTYSPKELSVSSIIETFLFFSQKNRILKIVLEAESFLTNITNRKHHIALPILYFTLGGRSRVPYQIPKLAIFTWLQREYPYTV